MIAEAMLWQRRGLVVIWLPVDIFCALAGLPSAGATFFSVLWEGLSFCRQARQTRQYIKTGPSLFSLLGKLFGLASRQKGLVDSIHGSILFWLTGYAMYSVHKEEGPVV